MYNCPNCSGNLSFDIPSQQLKCDYCGTQLDPYEYEKTQDAEESDYFGVTVYTCPQCGGEIMTTNVTAAGFCTYCGASTILDSRMKNEKRPTHIIPFKHTKEDCRSSYSSLVKRAFFAPRELRSPEHLDRFRGIYIPYWVYDYKLQGDLALTGTRSHRSGDYIITDHYRLTGQIDAGYEGITYDASSSLDDNVAESIAPFEASRMQPFTPSILCGFYADAPDVDSSVYKSDSCDAVCEDALDRISGFEEYRKAGVDMPGMEDFKKQLQRSGININPANPVCAYLPVWFLTYRKDDRVAYAVMNGSTGKITADLPVDSKKYLLGSLLLAVPLFAALSFLLTMTGQTVLLLSSVLALVSLLIYTLQLGAISDKDLRSNDKGYQFTRKDGAKQGKEQPETKKEGGKKFSIESVFKLGQNLIFILVILSVFRVGPLLSSLTAGLTFGIYKIYGIVSVVLLIAAIAAMCFTARSDTAKKGMFLHTTGSIAAVLTAAWILLLNPVSDLWFYGASILAALGVCLTFLGIIRKYNILATRPLPTFYDRKGGNDRA